MSTLCPSIRPVGTFEHRDAGGGDVHPAEAELGRLVVVAVEPTGGRAEGDDVAARVDRRYVGPLDAAGKDAGVIDGDPGVARTDVGELPGDRHCVRHCPAGPARSSTARTPKIGIRRPQLEGSAGGNARTPQKCRRRTPGRPSTPMYQARRRPPDIASLFGWLKTGNPGPEELARHHAGDRVDHEDVVGGRDRRIQPPGQGTVDEVARVHWQASDGLRSGGSGRGQDGCGEREDSLHGGTFPTRRRGAAQARPS